MKANSPLVIAIPKAGNNATEKACRLLRLEPAHHKHTANYHLADTNKVVYTYRNPRNVLVSAVRYQNEQIRNYTKDITEDKLIDLFFDFFNCSLPYTYRAYSRWMDTSACIIKFENLVSSIDEMNKIADYMGVEHATPETYGKLYGSSPTWSGRLSEWETVWTDGFDKIWKEEGMVEIEQGLGYQLG